MSSAKFHAERERAGRRGKEGKEGGSEGVMAGALNFFGFGPACDVQVVLDGEDERLRTRFRATGAGAAVSGGDGKAAAGGGGGEKTTGMLIYSQGDTVSGVVKVIPRAGKPVDHLGIQVQLLGQIELFFDKGNYYDLFRRASARQTRCTPCFSGGTIRIFLFVLTLETQPHTHTHAHTFPLDA